MTESEHLLLHAIHTELMLLREEMSRHRWTCGCGTDNGINLPTCRQCGRLLQEYAQAVIARAQEQP